MCVCVCVCVCVFMYGGSDSKGSACNMRDQGLIPGLGRSPGRGNGNPLQYSYLDNPMNRGAWWATFHGVTKLDTTNHAHTHAEGRGILLLCSRR